MIPKKFSDLHMPKYDVMLVLVNEKDEEYKVKILVQKAALSAGWRDFAVANKLLVGDVLVFQVVEPSKFKVYIVRANDPAKVDEEPDLQNLEVHADQVNSKKKIEKPLPSKVDENIHPTKTGIEDYEFTIFVNDSNIESELSQYHRTKYHKLCRTQKSILHAHLHKTVNSKFAAKIITQTVNIADSIEACKLSTFLADYSTWGNVLEGYELFGMNVRFLRDKITRILKVAFESKDAMDSKKFEEANIQRSCAENEIRILELKILELKNVVKKLDMEMEELKKNADMHEARFQQEVNNACRTRLLCCPKPHRMPRASDGPDRTFGFLFLFFFFLDFCGPSDAGPHPMPRLKHNT